MLAGAAAGVANGLFGAGGGMLLLPIMERTTDLKPQERFASSVCIILPISLVSLGGWWLRGGVFAPEAVPYLTGGAVGGIVAGLVLKRLPTKLLHRVMGAVIIWGGLRLLLQ